MNKFLRNSMIVFAIIVGIGLISIISGGMLGGLEQVIQLGNSGKLSWTLDPTHFENLDCIDCAGQSDNFPVLDDKYRIMDFENAVKGDEISEICVGLGAGTLTVDNSADDMVHISESNIPSLRCYVKENVLYVYANKKAGETPSGRKLFIEIPEDIVLTNYDMSIGAGTAYIKELKADEIDVEIGAGNAIVDEIHTASFTGKVGAGDFRVSDGIIGELQCDIGVGNFTYNGSIREDAAIRCAMGGATISLEEPEEYFNYNLTSAMGSISIGNRNFGGFSSDQILYNDSEYDFRVECAMGGIDISFEN